MIWAVVACSGLVRGEEERGLTEVYLASGIGRVRWTVLRSLGFAVAAALASSSPSSSGARASPSPVRPPDSLSGGVR